jgi:hypothetical protein
MTTNKSLIAVALPLEAIYKAFARGKPIRHVHPPRCNYGERDGRWRWRGR